MEKKNIADIKTHFFSLEELFDGNNYFVIPNYQRGYAWEQKHIDALWKDIEIAEINKKDHYMGVLALTNTEELSKKMLGLNKNTNCYDVVDGQQRLTTMFIILLELSRKINEIKDKHICNSDTGNYYLTYEAKGLNNEFLHDNIYMDDEQLPKNLYQVNLTNAKKIIKEKIENSNDINSIYKTITTRMKFNIYVNSSSFDVRKTFETMNYRGKGLTNLELLKNKLIYLSTKHQDMEAALIENITKAWENIYNNLGFDPDKKLMDDEFLKAHWLVYGKASSNMKSKGDAYADDILNNYFEETQNVTPKQILDYVQSLNKCSKFWKIVKSPIKASNDIQLDKTELKLLDKLSRIRTFTFVDSLLLAILKNKNNIDIDKRNELYETLEKFIFINYLVNSERNDLSFCMSYGKELFNETDKAKNSKKINELINKLVLDHELAITKVLPEAYEKLEQIIKYDYYNKFKGINYFLYEYNQYLVETCEKEGLPLSWNEFNSKSIEHVLPQKYKKTNYWNRVLQKYNTDINIIINSLGNLVGLRTNAKNASLSNKSYKIKKAGTKNGDVAYQKGTFAEREIADNNEFWTVKSIYDRTKSLAIFMCNNWFKDFESEYDEVLNDEKQLNKFINKIFVGFTVIEDKKEQKILENDLNNTYED